MELMVALLIGIIISIGVVQIFGATRSTYQLDEALARTQENGRFALEFLTQDIRHSGFLGCRREPRDEIVAVFNYLAPAISANRDFPINGVAAFEHTNTGIGATYTTPDTRVNTLVGWSPALTAPDLGGFAGALPGTDVIAIQRMAPSSLRLVAPYVTTTNVFVDPAVVDKVKVNDILMVADCQQAAMFMVTDITAATGTLGHTAGAATNRCASWTSGLDTANAAAAQCISAFEKPVPNTMIGTLETVVFFVANDPANLNQPTLFRAVLPPAGAGTAQALVEGVENFQVLYGVDNGVSADGIADLYVPASGVVNFRQVVSVQIGLLVYGINATGTANDMEIDTDNQIVAGTIIAPPTSGPGQRKKRRAFNTTIQLRNRGT